MKKRDKKLEQLTNGMTTKQIAIWVDNNIQYIVRKNNRDKPWPCPRTYHVAIYNKITSTINVAISFNNDIFRLFDADDDCVRLCSYSTMKEYNDEDGRSTLIDMIEYQLHNK